MPEPFETKRAVVYEEVVKEIKQQEEPKQLELFKVNELLKKENKKDIKIIGQLFDTYWIMEFENSMYIVDQHAAHEKVLFERFMKRYNDRSITSQMINPPVVFR